MEIPIGDYHHKHHHHHHCAEERDEYGAPCGGSFKDEYNPSPPPSQYVSYQIPVQDAGYGYFVNKPTVRVYTKAQTSYSLAIRDGQVILALSNPQDDSQVRLVPYDPNVFDESILWTESKDVGGGYKCIRMVKNILLNLDAFHGDKKHGGVHDGTVIVVWEWAKGDNQRWKIDLY